MAFRDLFGLPVGGVYRYNDPDDSVVNGVGSRQVSGRRNHSVKCQENSTHICWAMNTASHFKLRPSWCGAEIPKNRKNTQNEEPHFNRHTNRERLARGRGSRKSFAKSDAASFTYRNTKRAAMPTNELEPRTLRLLWQKADCH